ncbi:MAG: DNA-processing protein DprA [Thiotrichales bacterium]
MSETEAWLMLWRQPGIGPVNFQLLLSTFGTAEDALKASSSQWRATGLPDHVIADPADRETDISADLAWLEQENHHLLRLGDPGYPERLRDIPSAPPLLFVKGDPTLLDYPQLGMVGTRNPTGGGLQNAKAFAGHLAAAGLGISSGLALGIDGACHQAALDANGITIAVAATGLDRVYPARHKALATRIANEGAIVSELPVGTQVAPGNFPRRNRIISGLSLGTLVIEAARKSGSLITARYANEQGREVFAIPGSIHNPLARGCHQLIRQGGKLVETAEDILEELAPQLSNFQKHEPIQETASNSSKEAIDPEHLDLLKYIDFEPTPIDMIIIRSGLTAETVSSMLLIMELNDLISAEPGGYYIKLGSDA